MFEQRRVKLTAGRVKSQGGVVGIEDVITSLFFKPTALADHLKHGLQEEVIEWVFFQTQSEI